MTWLDITLIVIWVVFIAVGARLGSLFTGSCVIGGFVGAFLSDYYAHAASGMIGGFTGSITLAAIVLFLTGLLVVLIPGWFLSKVSSALFLGIIDSAFGLITGGLIGVVAISLLLLFATPVYPKIEKDKAWKKSKIVKPFHSALESVFNKSHFRPASITKKLKKETKKKLKPAAKKAAKKIRKAADEFVDELK